MSPLAVQRAKSASPPPRLRSPPFCQPTTRQGSEPSALLNLELTVSQARIWGRVFNLAETNLAHDLFVARDSIAIAWRPELRELARNPRRKRYHGAAPLRPSLCATFAPPHAIVLATASPGQTQTATAANAMTDFKVRNCGTAATSLILSARQQSTTLAILPIDCERAAAAALSAVQVGCSTLMDCCLSEEAAIDCSLHDA